MRVLLLSMPNTPYMAFNVSILPSLALSSLAGNIDECHKVEIADLIAIRRNFKKFLEIRLARHSPDIVGLSAKSFQANIARYIAKFIKYIDPEIKVVLGGYHATMATNEIVKSWGPELDFIIRGEGETSFNSLLTTLEGKTDELKNINGLTFRKNGQFVHNPRGRLEDLAKVKKP
ncbi:MAG: B12-binding domain-containing radical SAM protein, partial [Candidatus Hodarchaeota archaeon]